MRCLLEVYIHVCVPWVVIEVHYTKGWEKSNVLNIVRRVWRKGLLSNEKSTWADPKKVGHWTIGLVVDIGMRVGRRSRWSGEGMPDIPQAQPPLLFGHRRYFCPVIVFAVAAIQPNTPTVISIATIGIEPPI